jgi:hypothetical protein
MKKDAYYFSHDANAQDDPKCMILIDQMGMEGYGIFWALIEKLRNEKDFKLPLVITGSLAKRWGTSKEKVDVVIKQYGLFIIEDECFFSLRLLRSMNEKSEKARLSANYRWNNANAMQSHSERNAIGMRNDANKGKESKEKKSKEKEIIPSIYDFLDYAVLKKPSVDKKAVELKYLSWTENGWKDGNNKPITNWKTKLLNTLPYISENLTTKHKMVF